MSNSFPATDSCAAHSIRVASKLTGLNQHVIRIGEKRYQAVAPKRTGTNRRLYSDIDLQRLILLRRVTEAGHSIGNVARLPSARLSGLLEMSPDVRTRVRVADRDDSDDVRDAMSAPVERCVEAIRKLDATDLLSSLDRSIVELGCQGFLLEVAAPLLQRLGHGWQTGEITAAHEHFATSCLRTFLATANQSNLPHPSAPGLTVTTPAGQSCEMGACLVAALATNCGWHVTFLGANLPAHDIAKAAIQNRCRAVALSIVYPGGDPNLPGELVRLREYLPKGCSILAGGRAARSYSHTLAQIGAIRMSNLASLCTWLTDALL